MLYYLAILREGPQNFWGIKDFWVVTALSFFSTINFFLFLFYLPLLEESVKNAISIWRIYDIAFIVFIILLTRAFYVPASKS
jgi:quinol-cytochrome oxidoreductase complex cytochrome b subunit